MSLRRRVTLLAAVAAVVAVLLAVAVARAVHMSNHAVDVVDKQWGPATADANALLAHLVDQETGERGYLLTGDAAYLQPYRLGQRRAASDLVRLRALCSGDVQALELLADVENDATIWQTTVAAPEIVARQHRAPGAAALADTGRGKALFDKLRGDVHRLQALIEQRRAAAQKAVADANDTLTRWLWLSAAMVLLLGLLLGLGLVTWVLRPVGRLSAAMRRVSDGDLDAPVLVAGPPELAATSASADEMRRRILAELERSEAARQALEQRGPVVLGLSQQLAPRAADPVPGLRYSAALRPAEGMLAGDFVDVVPLPDGRVALVLLDVSGHGAAAGLEAMRLKTVLLTTLALGRRPDEAMAEAAAGFGDDERFATAVIVVVDPQTGALAWANAGHLPPRLLPVDRPQVTAEELRPLPPTGPLLSSMVGGWTTRTGRLEVGQLLLVFSDGLTEARDAQGHEFGIDGVCAALSQTTVRDVDSAVSVCLAAVRAHAVDQHRDDITLLAVTRDPATLLPVPTPVRDDVTVTLPTD